MEFHFLASEPHYLEHMEPIRRSLSVFNIEGEKGVNTKVLLPNQLKTLDEPNVMVVASWKDFLRARLYHNGPIVAMEHGAGQSYMMPNDSYAGGDRTSAAAIFVPGDHPYKQVKARYPRIPVLRIGSPKLGKWVDKYRDLNKLTKPKIPIIGISFHWNCQVCPETQATWPEWLPVIEKIARENPQWKFVGTSHPREANVLRPLYENSGIDWTDSMYSGVNPDILLCDNSSLGFEFAYCQRPTIWLNSFKYRKTIEHGLRFWDCVQEQIQVDHSRKLANTAVDLKKAIEAALNWTPEQQALVNMELKKVYTRIPTRGLKIATKYLVKIAVDFLMRQR